MTETNNAGVTDMAYFRQNEPVTDDQYSEMEETEIEYDDGFDDLQETEIPEISPEEKAERNKSRVRLALGAGNLFGVITGAVLILLLLTMIFSIVHFVISDMSRSFSLFQTNF